MIVLIDTIEITCSLPLCQTKKKTLLYSQLYSIKTPLEEEKKKKTGKQNQWLASEFVLFVHVTAQMDGLDTTHVPIITGLGKSSHPSSPLTYNELGFM